MPLPNQEVPFELSLIHICPKLCRVQDGYFLCLSLKLFTRVMIATIINTNVNKLSYVTYISLTPFRKTPERRKAVPPSCLGKYIILCCPGQRRGEIVILQS